MGNAEVEWMLSLVHWLHFFCLDYRNTQVNHENFLFSPEAFYNATLGGHYSCYIVQEHLSQDWTGNSDPKVGQNSVVVGQ